MIKIWSKKIWLSNHDAMSARNNHKSPCSIITHA